jgi:hypothetical protein
MASLPRFRANTYQDALKCFGGRPDLMTANEGKR